MTFVLWNLLSVHLEIVSVQDRCTVCAKHTIGSEIVWTHLMLPLVTRLMWKLVSILLEIVLILTQDRCWFALNIP